jgi:hypothetical protein
LFLLPLLQLVLLLLPLVLAETTSWSPLALKPTTAVLLLVVVAAKNLAGLAAGSWAGSWAAGRERN